MSLLVELRTWAVASPFAFGLAGGLVLAAFVLGWHLVARIME